MSSIPKLNETSGLDMLTVMNFLENRITLDILGDLKKKRKYDSFLNIFQNNELQQFINTYLFQELITFDHIYFLNYYKTHLNETLDDDDQKLVNDLILLYNDYVSV